MKRDTSRDKKSDTERRKNMHKSIQSQKEMESFQEINKDKIIEMDLLCASVANT